MNLFFFLILTSFPEANLQPQHAVVNREGVFLVTEKGFVQYDFQGEKILDIPASSEDDILLKLGDIYIVQDTRNYQLRFFSERGKETQVLKNTSWRSLTKLTDNMFAAVPTFFWSNHLDVINKKFDLRLGPNRYLKIYDPGSNPNPLMINLVHVEFEDGQWELKPGRSFFRATKEQKLLRLDSKKMFIELSDGIFYVMTELNDKIYYYDDETIQAERSTDPRMPFQKPSLQLELKNFVRADGTKEYPKNIYFDMDEFKKDQVCWKFSRSKVLHFSRESSGFMVVYSVPTKQENLPCDTVDIYIQELAIDGTNIGEPIVIERQRGNFAGLIKDKLYWFSRDLNSKTGVLETITIR